MNLHTLHHTNVVYFSTTDYDDFLNKCVDLYNEVSDDTWEDYTSPEELPEIFEQHAYHYQVNDAMRLVNINSHNDLVNLYFKLQSYNPTINFDNGTTLMLACNRLLKEYHDETINYINDDKNEVSLLQQIAGDNGLDQLAFHKQFRNTYGISIY